jgi:hypothetical protein
MFGRFSVACKYEESGEPWSTKDIWYDSEMVGNEERGEKGELDIGGGGL